MNDLFDMALVGLLSREPVSIWSFGLLAAEVYDPTKSRGFHPDVRRLYNDPAVWAGGKWSRRRWA